MKTVLQDILEDMQRYMESEDAGTDAQSAYLDAITLIKSYLPSEREQIEQAYTDAFKFGLSMQSKQPIDAGFNILSASDYFNETYNG